MAKSEKVFWYVLDRLHGNSVTMRQEIANLPTQENRLLNALGIGDLEGEIALTFEKAESTDTLYFRKRRAKIPFQEYSSFGFRPSDRA